MKPEPVDHKDKPGKYRQQVRSAVFDRVGAQGQPVTSHEQLVGDWRVSFVGFQQAKPKQVFVYRLDSQGEAVIEAANQAPSIKNHWRLNADGTFSLFVWTAAMPEFGLPDPTEEEVRMHVAALPDGSFVLWNGDGSLVKLLSPLAEGNKGKQP